LENLRINHGDLYDPNGNAIFVKQSNKSQKIKLSFSPHARLFTLSLPKGGNILGIHHFIKRSQIWMKKQIEKPGLTVPIIYIRDGQKLCLVGKEYTLKLKVDLKKSVVFYEDTIEICGPRSQFVTIFEQSIKDLIKKILYQRCFVLSKKMGNNFNKLTLKDAKTRWGSCSAKGNLNFSWRLILAPSSVIDYLCAHEVAHLTEMHHGKKFWELVARYCPDYQEKRKWLKTYGTSLMHVQFES
jgi:predicted metal-dependent hydrolase